MQVEEMPIGFFFINLDTAIDRREWFEKQAEVLGLHFERITAEDSKNPHLVERYLDLNPGPHLTVGEYACRKSHVRAWNAFLQSNKSFAAIFEDDAYIASDLRDLLSDNRFPQEAELLRLETYSNKVVCAKYGVCSAVRNRLFLPLLSGAFGSAGYFISRGVAKLLLQVEPGYHGQVDGLLWSERSPLRKHLSPLQLKPAACIQDDQLAKFEGRSAVFQSSIKTGKRLKDPRDRAATTRLGEICRYGKHLTLGADPFRYKRVIPVAL